jgi:hypothetical protein
MTVANLNHTIWSSRSARSLSGSLFLFVLSFFFSRVYSFLSFFGLTHYPRTTWLRSIRVSLSLELGVLEGPGCWLPGGGVLNVAARTCPVR